MAKKIEALRGMEDILPGEIEKWQWLEEKARVFFESRGFREIRTPILEYTDLFVRSVGESSDIVHKEMFSFQDRGDRNVTMRPEMTASAARSVIEKGLLSQAKSLRFYYVGPMFRAERPQAGRKRQFHQIGIEILNEPTQQADLDSIQSLVEFLCYVGLKDVTLKMNDLGDPVSQEAFKAGLREFFETRKASLCQDCQWRLEKNVLRILDCKTPACQAVIEDAKQGVRRQEDSSQVEALAQKLEAAGALTRDRILMDARLVRGLDYYNGIVFEVTSEGLGAQNAVAGGGRYDRLYGDLGGPAVSATGFSIGMERLLACLEHQQPGKFKQEIGAKKVYLAPLENSLVSESTVHKTSLGLREKGIRIELLPGEYSLSKHLKKANQAGVRFVAILGADEMAHKVWTVKDMEKKCQETVDQEKIVNYFLKGLDEGVCL